MDRIIVKFLSGGRAGHTEVYPVTRFSSLYLGRDPKCDIRVDAERDAMVSRSHAVIEWVDHEEEGWRQYTLTDLLSSNGTYLNGQRVHGTVDLSSGDHIRLGVQGPEFLLEVEHPEPNLQAVVTQSLRADQFLRTPPPRTRSAADGIDASATVRGAHLASRVEQNIEQPAATSTAGPGQKRDT
ncbi:MAG TPA: FHA domain-containing protein [Xanthomonadales bacterium]|nr:FHA domain-containing protein [Xanthomonadales bacterium]